MLWLVPLIVLGPPAVFALYEPRTPKWRRARRVYWVVLPVMLGGFVFNLLVIDPAGRAAVYYGAWGVMVAVAAVYCISVGTIRAEWQKHRRAGQAGAEQDEGRMPWGRAAGTAAPTGKTTPSRIGP